MNKIPSLEEMHDWVDYDIAHFAIGRALGVFDKDFHETANVAAIFYTKNIISDSLIKIADELVRIGFLDCDSENLKYRLKKGFDVAAIKID